jgi:Rad3-related DNA helicase
VTKNKQLQQQLIETCPEARSMMGRNNYPCVLRPLDFSRPAGDPQHFSAADCTERNKPKLEKKECSRRCAYTQAKEAALEAPIAVLNTAYFLAEINGPGLFGESERVVVDEADALEADLMSFIELTVSSSQLKKWEIDRPDEPDRIQSWVIWADYAGHALKLKASEIKNSLPRNASSWNTFQIEASREAQRIERLVEKLSQFKNDVNPDTWIMFVTSDDKGKMVWHFKPVVIAPYAEKYLWSNGESWLLMSGTILHPASMVRDLGIDRIQQGNKTSHYTSMPSPFKLENRPVCFWPVASMTYKERKEELPKLVPAIIKILERYANERVLIHSVSYDLTQFLLLNLSTQVDRPLMTHQAENRSSTLDKFKATPGAILISPSFDRGVDLPDDLCRCIIVPKMPYMDISDQQVAARLELPGGQLWYLIQTTRTLIQMTGRGVRHDKDWCHSWILDKKFTALRAQLRSQGIFPRWWLDAVRTVEL